MAGGFASWCCCFLLLRGLAASKELQLVSNRRLLAGSPQQVSIYDGVLPSPDLTGPIPSPLRAPVASAPAQAAVKAAGISCGRGCIAGSIIGGVVILALFLGILIFMCCRQSSVKDEVLSTMSTGDLELLDHPVPPAKGPMSFQTFRVGDAVFCRQGRNCVTGVVTGQAKGDAYKVQFSDGTSDTIQNSWMAPNYGQGTELLYSSPDGRPSVTGILLQADGSYWPPFYQVRPNGGGLNTVNTTAEFLTKLNKDLPASYISASAV